jgi:hypothetical protein
VAVQTDVGDGSAEVWRFAQHRSNVNDDDDPGVISFWYTPRPNVSRDGRWVLFTSNWEKTLGTDPQGVPGGKAREDVFLLRLPAVEDTSETPFQPLAVTTALLPDGRVGQPYSATLQASRTATWRVTNGALPRGLVLLPSGEITGAPLSTGEATFEVTAAEEVDFTSRALTIVVTR